jgi:hypothetical protein
MYTDQRKFLEKRYRASEWHGRSRHAKHGPREFDIEGWKIPGWMLQRMRRDDLVKPRVVHSIWRDEELAHKLVAIDAFVCSSVEEAHDRLIETLGAVESEVVERQAGKNAVGDVAFGLNGAMILFARANLLVLIRSLGSEIAPVEKIAQQLDKMMDRPADKSGKK